MTLTSRCEVLDTFAGFLEYWRKSRLESIDAQIRLWKTLYMEKYPELFMKQIRTYEQEDMDWQEVAGAIFTMFPFHSKHMRDARANIIKIAEPLHTKASERLRLDFGVLFVVYVGIGCGAGWATVYSGKPAVLLGLENIAEEK